MKSKTFKIKNLFRALADENRVKMLLYIKNCKSKCVKGGFSVNETCLKDFSKCLNISVPTISHHIKELSNADIISTRKEGRWVYCKINPKVIRKISGFLNAFLKNKGRCCK